MIHCHMFHHMMNHMASMVGPMAGHQGHGMRAGAGMQNSLGMLQLGRGESQVQELGPALGRGTGEQTGSERAVRTGPAHGNHNAEAAPRVPGYPQDMMDMHGMYSEAEIRRLSSPLTQGMRHSWFTGVEALMTVLRVLPSELYERLMAGEEDIPPGASVPGGTPGQLPGHQHQNH